MRAYRELGLLAFLFAICVATLTNSSLQSAQMSNNSIKETSSSSNLTTSSSSKLRLTPQLEHGGAKQTFYVWPNNGTNPAHNKALLDHLTELTGLGLDEVMVSQLGSDLSKVNFFTVNMTEDAAEKVASASEVLTVTLKGSGAASVDFDSGEIREDPVGNATIHIKRDTSYTTDPDQRPEMVYISQPRNVAGGVPLDRLGGKYVYPQSAGSGAFIYMIDSGADDTSSEFNSIRTTWRWAGPNYDRSANGGSYPDGVIGDHVQNPHGTRVLSKAAGTAYGVAKTPHVIVVRRSQVNDIEDAINQLTWVVQDWLSHRDSATVKVGSIIIAWGYFAQQLNFDQILKLHRFESLIVDAIEAGLLPICAAGNNPGPVGSYPALFPSNYDWNGRMRPPPASEMLVIGATDNTGRKSPGSSSGLWVRLTAPGLDIMTAQYKSTPEERDGTSYAAPQVAGLAAVLAAEGDYVSVQGSWEAGVSNLRQELMFLAYSRSPRTPSVFPLGIWNGVRTVNDQCGTWVPPTSKRETTTDECSINTNTTSSNTNPISSSTTQTTSSATSAQTSPASPAKPTAPNSDGRIYTNVTVAPSSLILGFNKTSLLNTIVPKLSQMCDPANTTCAEYGEIDNVYSYAGNFVTRGTVRIKIPESRYDTRAQRDGMLLRAAQAMSASGSNCATHAKKEGNCFRRRLMGGSLPCIVTPVQVCHFTDSVDVVVVKDGVGLIAQTQIEFSFDFPGEALLCEEIVEAIEIDTALIVLFPEFTAPLVEIREALGVMEAWCKDINKVLTEANGGTGD